MRTTVLLVGIAIQSTSCVHGKVESSSGRPDLQMSADQRGVVAASINGVLDLLPPGPTEACVVLWGGPPAYWYNPDVALLRAVRSRGLRVVGDRDCPRTYDSMVALVDSAGRSLSPPRPAGHVDPYRVEVLKSTGSETDASTVEINVGQGTANRAYRCVVRRVEGDRWVGWCEKTGKSVSSLPPNGALRHIT